MESFKFLIVILRYRFEYQNIVTPATGVVLYVRYSGARRFGFRYFVGFQYSAVTTGPYVTRVLGFVDGGADQWLFSACLLHRRWPT